MKAVLISIQPYWVFLIIARKMGWNIDKEKTIEVRKGFPKADCWNKKVKIYCSKNKKSFAEIPKAYQPLMEKFLGKVIGEFVCDRIDSYVGKDDDNKEYWDLSVKEWDDLKKKSCLTIGQIIDYTGDSNNCYGWHISQLKIYDKPKELSEFAPICRIRKDLCKVCCFYEEVFGGCCRSITRPPQSWCYVEELQNG